MTAATRALVVAAVVGVGLLGSPGQVRAGKPDRVGRIIIEGNNETPDHFIREQVAIYPGQILQYPSLEAARTRLARSGLFCPDNPPSVDVLPNGGNFKDIVVRVKERQPGTWARYVVRDGVLAVRTGHVGMMVETARRLLEFRPPERKAAGGAPGPISTP